MVNTMIHIVSIICLALDCIFLLGVLLNILIERFYKKNIRILVKQYNKRINTFQWYYEGDSNLKGINELSDIYFGLQRTFQALEPIYNAFLKKYFKVASKSEKYQKTIEVINKFAGVDHEIFKNGVFLKVRQKRRLGKKRIIESSGWIHNGKKHMDFNLPRLYLLPMIAHGLLIVAVGFLAAYVVQFVWIDGLYVNEVTGYFLKIILFVAGIIPAIIALVYSIHEGYFDSYTLLMWGIWAIGSAVCIFLLIIVVYSIKDLSYAILLVKWVIDSELYIGIFLLYVLVSLFKRYPVRNKVLEELFQTSKMDLDEVLQEEFETRLEEDLEMLNDYINLLQLQLKMDANDISSSMDNMSLQEKMCYIYENPQYQIRAKKMDDAMKNEIVSVLCDYKCLEAVLSRPFARNGKADVKGMRDTYDRLLKNFGGG